MMRILQICNKAPFPPNDGSSIAISNMAQGLAVNGADVHLICINTRKHFKPDEKIPHAQRERFHYRSVYRNTNPSAFGALLNIFTPHSYFVSRFGFRNFRNELRSVLSGNTFDIIQLEGLFMGMYIPVIRKYSKAKIVLRAHNIEHLIWQRHIGYETGFLRRMYLQIQTRRLKHFECEVLDKIDALVPISRTDAAEFVKIGYKGPVHSCITGVNARPKTDRINERPQSVFYIGSMDWLPNREAVLWFLENCWEKVREQVPQAKLYIGGKGMPLSFFQRTWANVVFMEHVESAPDFFHDHQVMIVPLLSGSGLRIKIIEGMSYGKAIVSTTIGAEGIPYTDGKNILIADTPEHFSSCVVDLLNDPARRTDLASNAAAVAREEFDNVRVTASLIAFYTALVNG